MNTSDKKRAWLHIKQHSPRQESFIRALKAAFGSIELVSYRTIKNPLLACDGLSNNNGSLRKNNINNRCANDG